MPLELGGPGEIGVPNGPDSFVIPFSLLMDMNVPVIHRELGFGILSHRWASVLESDGHVLGSGAALQGSIPGVPNEFSPCSNGKERKSP